MGKIKSIILKAEELGIDINDDMTIGEVIKLTGGSDDNAS